MKFTDRDKALINEMIRGEAERVIKGRRLFTEEGPDMRRVGADVASKAVRDDAYEFGMQWGQEFPFQKLHAQMARALTKAGTGGPGSPSVTPLDFEEMVSPDDLMDAQMEMVGDISMAIEKYATELAKYMSEMVSDEDAMDYE